MASRDYSPAAVCRLLISVAPLVSEHSSRVHNPQQLRHVGAVVELSRAQAHYLWHSSLAAPVHEEFSQTRDQTCVSCIRRKILYRWATREAPMSQTFRSWVMIQRAITIWEQLPINLWEEKIVLLTSNLSFQRRQWHPTPVLSPGKSHGRRSLVGCSPWGRKSRTRLSNFTSTFQFHALEKEMATIPVFLPGESQGRGSLVGCLLWGRTGSDTTEAT